MTSFRDDSFPLFFEENDHLPFDERSLSKCFAVRRRGIVNSGDYFLPCVQLKIMSIAIKERGPWRFGCANDPQGCSLSVNFINHRKTSPILFIFSCRQKKNLQLEHLHPEEFVRKKKNNESNNISFRADGHGGAWNLPENEAFSSVGLSFSPHELNVKVYHLLSLLEVTLREITARIMGCVAEI